MKWKGKINFEGRPQYDDAGLITSSEVDTISGSLQTNIDEKSNNVHIHDDRYYTESEVDDLLTTVSGEHNELDGLNEGDYKHLTADEYGSTILDRDIPGNIGETTPGSGKFTTIEATTGVINTLIDCGNF